MSSPKGKFLNTHPLLNVYPYTNVNVLSLVLCDALRYQINMDQTVKGAHTFSSLDEVISERATNAVCSFNECSVQSYFSLSNHVLVNIPFVLNRRNSNGRRSYQQSMRAN